MLNYFNIIIGIVMLPIGLFIAIPNINAKIDGKSSKYGLIMRGIFTGIGIFILGLIMILRELF